jgi:hypothetical protein
MFKTKTKISLVAVAWLVLSFGVFQKAYADPPVIEISTCNENDTSQDGTQVCKGGEMITCNASTLNQLSTNSKSVCKASEWLYCKLSTKDQTSADGKLACDGTIWKSINPAPPVDNSCTPNGKVSSDQTKICQSLLWVQCTAGKDGDVISGKTCTSGKWIVPAPTPPGTTCTNGALKNTDSQICKSNAWITCSAITDGDVISGKTCTAKKWVTSTPNPGTPTALITKVTVFPASFNPAIDSTKISYTTSANAMIDIKITDSVGQPAATLLDNQAINAGSASVDWYGTIGNKQGGTVLHSGTYKYKIVTKNTKTGAVEDSKEGTINLIYAAPDPVPDPVKDPEKVLTPDEQAAKDKLAKELAAQSAATLALQNAKKGKTAKVGPDVLIYGLFPLAGYFISRRRK